MEEKWAAAIINFFFERDFAQQPKSALILTTLHVLFDTLYVNCKDQIMALAATICSTSKETLSKNPYALGVILTTCTILHFVWSWNSICKGIRTKHWLKSRYKTDHKLLQWLVVQYSACRSLDRKWSALPQEVYIYMYSNKTEHETVTCVIKPRTSHCLCHILYFIISL